VPLPKEKHEETVEASSANQPDEGYESDTGLESLDLPEVPKAAIHLPSDAPSIPDVGPHVQNTKSVPHEPSNSSDLEENPMATKSVPHEPSNSTNLEENPTADDAFRIQMQSMEHLASAPSSIPDLSNKENQFIPFASPPPSIATTSLEKTESIPSPSPSPPVKPTEPEIFTKTDEVTLPPVPHTDYTFSRQPKKVHTISPTESRANIDLDDVLSSAQTAADSAEQAAAAACAAANLAQLRIADLKKNSNVYDKYSDFVQKETHHQSEATQKPVFDHQDSFTNNTQDYLPSHLPQRSSSLEDDPFSYPNLFSSSKP
jgi:hypothetical protein